MKAIGRPRKKQNVVALKSPTAEARERMSRSQRGRAKSEAHRAAMLAAHTTVPVRVIVNGVVHSSIIAAAKANGVSATTIRNWLARGLAERL